MKILVTGGSGYLGNHICKYFDADDMSRRANMDLLNLQDVHAAADYDVVIHMAAHLDKSPEAAEEVFLTNVEGTLNLLRVIRSDTLFIFASTKDVYGRFSGSYREVPEDCPTIYSGQSALEWSKLIAEKYVDFYANANGFRSCIFRLSTIYAPPSEGNTPGFVGYFADAINHGKRIRLPGEGKPRRDILHVDDLAKACEAMIESVIRHGTYNIGGGPMNTLSLRELVGKLEEVSGLQALIDENDPLPDPVPMNYTSKIELANLELGWSPTIDLNTGLKTLF